MRCWIWCAQHEEPARAPGGQLLQAHTRTVCSFSPPAPRSGCFVAGKDAGRAYNTWPDMNGEWFPSEYFSERLPGEEE